MLDASAKEKLGRKPSIDDERLVGVRDHLVWLLETTWDQIGGELRFIKSASAILPILEIWKDKSNEYVISALLRPSSSFATSQQLAKQRRQLRSLNEKARLASGFLDKCVNSFERAMRISVASLPEGEQIVVDEQIRKRVAVLAHTGRECLAINDQQKNLENILIDGEAYFARQEFFQFCKSGRYSLNPLNSANAMAGLPFIGWRQSAKRCKKWKAAGANGISYQVLEIIKRIVARNTRRSELIVDAEQWLRNRRSTESNGVSQLQQHWYYLRRAIQTEVDKGTSRRYLPYAISKEYWRRKRNPSAVDLAFAEEEIIAKLKPHSDLNSEE